MVLFRPTRGRSWRIPVALAEPPVAADRPVSTPIGEGARRRERGARRVPQTALAASVTAGAAVLALGLTDLSWGFPVVADSCDRTDVMVSVVAGAPRAGQGAAQVQYTARSGRSCTLTGAQPVSLVGADGIAVVFDDSFAAHSVTVSRGHPAHQTLRWNLSADPNHRVEPTALLARTSNWSGDPVRWAWRFGPISTATGDGSVRVGLVQSGPALPVAAGTVSVPAG
jgi:hypothetical protein